MNLITVQQSYYKLVLELKTLIETDDRFSVDIKTDQELHDYIEANVDVLILKVIKLINQ